MPITLGTATESDVVQGLAPANITAPAIALGFAANLGVVDETDTAATLIVRSRITLSPAHEADTAPSLGITHVVPGTPGQPFTSPTLQTPFTTGDAFVVTDGEARAFSTGDVRLISTGPQYYTVAGGGASASGGFVRAFVPIPGTHRFVLRDVNVIIAGTALVQARRVQITDNAEKIDVTNQQSTSGYREYVQGDHDATVEAYLFSDRGPVDRLLNEAYRSGTMTLPVVVTPHHGDYSSTNPLWWSSDCNVIMHMPLDGGPGDAAITHVIFATSDQPTFS